MYTSFVMVDATNSSRVYAGVGGVKSTFLNAQGTFYEGGIYASTDGGESWSALTLPPGVNTNIFMDMVLRGSNQQTIYASGQIHGSDAPVAYGLIRSRDRGQTWSIVNPPGETIHSFDAFRGNPDILYGHDFSRTRRVHRSSDGGTTWTATPAGFFGTLRIHPTNSQIVIYTGDRAKITKTTDGFATFRHVYEDPELPPNQQMVDIKFSLSNPNVVWAAAKGYYLYKSTDGGETFTKITAIRDMIYGNTLSQDVPAAENTATMLTGIAVANSAGSSATVTFSLFNNDGLRFGTTVLPLTGGTQASRLYPALFGTNTPREGGWVNVLANRAGVRGFFLNFDPGLTAMDGVPLTNRPVTDFVFPQVENARISLVNPSTRPAIATLRFINDTGADTAPPLTVQLMPGVRHVASFNQSGFIRVTSDSPLTSVAQLGIEGQAISMINGLSTDLGARILYSPQYVAGGGYRTTVTVVNLEDSPSTLNVSWLGNNGSAVAPNIRVPIPAGGRVVLRDGEAFGMDGGAAPISGYLRISGSTLMTGTVKYGDPDEAQFQTTLPLMSAGQSEAIYAQLAQDSTWFTGIAIINPDSSPANVTIRMFNSDGSPAGAGRRMIPAGGRIAELVNQIAPDLGATSSGFFRVSSDRAVLSFGVFGTHNLSVLSAIPPIAP